MASLSFFGERERVQCVFIFDESLLRKSMSVVGYLGSEGWDVGEIMET